MSDHGWAVDLAVEQVAENGRDIQLISHIETGNDWNPTRTKTSQTVKGLNVSLRNDEIPQGLVGSVTAAFLIDSKVEPENKMNLVDGAKTYSILGVVDLYPGEQKILYRVFVSG